MSEHNGRYVKLSGNPQFWAVDDGERRPIHSKEEMLAIGLRNVVTVTKEQLDAIPIKGQKKAKPK